MLRKMKSLGAYSMLSPSEDGRIQFVAWKDNALVLFMTTVAGELDLVEKQRKRPSETSTSAKTARAPFRDNATAILGIPILNVSIIIKWVL
jgi:hypothetical protein